MKLIKVRRRKGGPGSGNFGPGHIGRPGLVGGSASQYENTVFRNTYHDSRDKDRGNRAVAKLFDLPGYFDGEIEIKPVYNQHGSPTDVMKIKVSMNSNNIHMQATYDPKRKFLQLISAYSNDPDDIVTLTYRLARGAHSAGIPYIYGAGNSAKPETLRFFDHGGFIPMLKDKFLADKFVQDGGKNTSGYEDIVSTPIGRDWWYSNGDRLFKEAGTRPDFFFETRPHSPSRKRVLAHYKRQAQEEADSFVVE